MHFIYCGALAHICEGTFKGERYTATYSAIQMRFLRVLRFCLLHQGNPRLHSAHFTAKYFKNVQLLNWPDRPVSQTFCEMKCLQSVVKSRVDARHRQPCPLSQLSDMCWHQIVNADVIFILFVRRSNGVTRVML